MLNSPASRERIREREREGGKKNYKRDSCFLCAKLSVMMIKEIYASHRIGHGSNTVA